MVYDEKYRMHISRFAAIIFSVVALLVCIINWLDNKNKKQLIIQAYILTVELWSICWV